MQTIINNLMPRHMPAVARIIAVVARHELATGASLPRRELIRAMGHKHHRDTALKAESIDLLYLDKDGWRAAPHILAAIRTAQK